MNMNLKTYWWPGRVNFGDLLTKDILKTYNFNPKYAKPDEAQLVCIGSVLQWIPESYSGYILGSGLMKPMNRHFTGASILSIRGNLTRQCLGLPKDVPLGDPGLISDRLLSHRQKKKYVLGLIPHFENKDDIKIQSFIEKYPNDVLIIDVERQPSDVVKEIDECQFIASSSLHGLIVADSFGIPNTWLHISKSVGGGKFKFDDYGTSIRKEINPFIFTGNESLSELISSTSRTQVNLVNDLKMEIDGAFKILQYSI